MKKSQLEKVLEHLINEDAETAEALLHDFILDQAKKVHREMMQVNEGIEDETLTSESTEEYFDGSELAEGDEEEAGEGEDQSGEGEEATADLASAATDDESGEGEEASAEGDDEEAEEERVDSLEDRIDAMQAQLDALVGRGDEGMDDDQDITEPMTDDGADQAPVPGEGEEVPAEEGFMFEDDDFSDLEESFELEPVHVELKDGKEIGAGASVSQNVASPIPQKKVDDRAFKGEATEIRSTQHKGYSREASPAVKQMPARKNVQKTAEENLEGVAKEGNKSAVLNKKDGFGAENNKSPIGSSGTRSGVK